MEWNLDLQKIFSGMATMWKNKTASAFLRIDPEKVYLLKINKRNTKRQTWNMFKVKNKEILIYIILVS